MVSINIQANESMVLIKARRYILKTFKTQNFNKCIILNENIEVSMLGESSATVYICVVV